MISNKVSLLQRISQQRREEDRQYVRTSPMKRATEIAQKQLDEETEYRKSILSGLKVFEKMTKDEITNVAQSMEELRFVKGDVFIRQDEIGNSMFIVQEGVLEVTEKINTRDPDEVPTLVATIDKHPSLFGERSLITKEPRSATVTVISEYAKCLRMTKDSLDSLVETTNKVNGATRESIARDVVRRLPLLKDFTPAEKEEVFKHMISVPFTQGSYVFREGTIGNHFYIVTEGLLTVTKNNDKGKDREMGLLHPGDYFGEVALLGNTSTKRTANVYVLESCNLMQLSRTDFSKFLGNLRDEMLQLQSAKNTIKQKKKGAVSFAGKRRVSSLGINNIPKDELVSSVVVRLFKFCTLSLWNSLYHRFYRDITLGGLKKAAEYGSLALELEGLNLDRKFAVMKIATLCRRILEKTLEMRTIEENLLIVGIFHQKNTFRDKITAGWTTIRFNEICKRITYQKVSPMQKIIEAGRSGSKAYIIIRGSVRVFSEVTDDSTGRSTLFFQEDLTSGDVFGESALGGTFKRTITVISTNYTDLALIESQDYLHVLEGGTRKLSVDEKCKILNDVFLFKNIDFYRKFELAHSLNQMELERGQKLFERGKITSCLYFIIEGSVDFNAAGHKGVISTIQSNNYVGESGILCFKSSTKSYKELFTAVAASRLECLVLPESHYNILENSVLIDINNAYLQKKGFRKERKKELSVAWHKSHSSTLPSFLKNIEFDPVEEANPNVIQLTSNSVIESSLLNLPALPEISGKLLMEQPRPYTADSQHSRPKATITERPHSASSIDDIHMRDVFQELLHGCGDHLLATATCKNKKEKKKLRITLSHINKLRVERVKLRNAENYRFLGQVTSIESTPDITRGILYSASLNNAFITAMPLKGSTKIPYPESRMLLK